MMCYHPETGARPLYGSLASAGLLGEAMVSYEDMTITTFGTVTVEPTQDMVDDKFDINALYICNVDGTLVPIIPSHTPIGGHRQIPLS